MTISERFLKYVSFDTQSDEDSNTIPSTLKQLEFAKYLLFELKQLNIDAHLNEYGIVYAKIKANNNSKKTIGLIAHMDTATDLTGKDVNPRIIYNYDGSDIVLNSELNIIMSPDSFVSLKDNINKDLIVTDGTTLLGGDDKAGIAIIMDFVEYVVKHPEYKHCNIAIAFTPDEEIGKGADNFDVKYFNADFAYTIDGGPINEISYENFNAASAKVIVNGNSIHPGSAKNKMINSILVANEFNLLLPQDAIPSKTEGYEGFNHLCDIQGNCEKTIMDYIIRNHDAKLLEKQKQDFCNAAKIINKKYQPNTIELIIKDSYKNMKELILQKPIVLETVFNAFKKLNIEYKLDPIRGGTDGARLTYDGLPTPNLGTGGYNCHGKYEYVVVQQMETMVNIIKEIFNAS